MVAALSAPTKVDPVGIAGTARIFLETGLADLDNPRVCASRYTLLMVLEGIGNSLADLCNTLSADMPHDGVYAPAPETFREHAQHLQEEGRLPVLNENRADNS